jgi:hypothetical protein
VRGTQLVGSNVARTIAPTTVAPKTPKSRALESVIQNFYYDVAPPAVAFLHHQGTFQPGVGPRA